MAVIGFIPARAGSTRIKNKNIKKLGKYPLFFWTVLSAIKSNAFDQIIFSSDSVKYFRILQSELKKINTKKKTKILFDKREKKNARKKTKIFDYLKGDFLKKFQFKPNDIIVMMLPTCPLRKTSTINECLKLSKRRKSNVFTVTTYDYHVSFALDVKKDLKWSPLMKSSPTVTGNTQSQSQKKFFYPTDSVDCIFVKNLKKMKTVYDNGLCYITEKKEAIDIDDKYDFELCRKLI